MKHLFFEGPPRIGKSTCLREAVNRCAVKVCGYTVQRVIDGGQIVGYQATIVRSLPLPSVDIEYDSGMPGLFLHKGKSDISVLEQVIADVEAMLATTSPDCVVLDEIGGVELASEAFMQPLLRILASAIPCIGIIKSSSSLAHAAKMFHQQATILEAHDQLTKTITRQGEIVTVTPANKGDMARLIELHMRKSR